MVYNSALRIFPKSNVSFDHYINCDCKFEYIQNFRHFLAIHKFIKKLSVCQKNYRN